MAKNEQSRKYLLTINNPADCGLTHDKIKTLVQSLSPAYFCMADEIASTGTHHTHIFLYRPSPVRWHTVKNLFPTAHIDKAYGSAQENRDYIQKGGKWAETNKAETAVADSFEEYGHMQCLKQPNVQVTIADFKGGVDFGSPWRKHPNCKLILDRETLLCYLDDVTEKLEQRKDVLGKTERRDIYDYNRHEPIPMDRIVFAVDEVAEILDKTGLNKEEKEQVARIENRLSTIARQGRAFGIHLFLSTQRPDANILSGQIKNNIGYRICGRADHVLSSIILDNTDASDKIPHDAQGRFLTGDGTVFQAYWFDDTKEVF